MIYTFNKPKDTNVWKATWDNIKTKWYFWLPIPFVFIFGPFILIIPIGYAMFSFNKARSAFWKEFAEANGWKYEPLIANELLLLHRDNTQGENGLMFKEGDGRLIMNKINGSLNERSFRMFCYQFGVGSGKTRRIFYYTVFAFKVAGTFPHLYLNNKTNSWGISAGEHIPLPNEFEDRFSLIAPKKYEIEALEVFTPDILSTILDNKFPYDVEFINQEIIVFADGVINKFEQLETRFNEALELRDILSPKLDKFKFEKIGDMPSTL